MGLFLIFRLVQYNFFIWEIGMTAHTRLWTTEEIEKLKRLAGKRPPAEIAAELGRTPGAMAVKAHQLNISLKVGKKPAGSHQLSESSVANWWLPFF
jgi:hypothetical protein